MEKKKHFENLLFLAEAIATSAHEDQTDKAGVPYIEHPKTVASFCDGTHAKIVGWLHDVIEDTPVSIEDLRHLGFDEFLLEALSLVTKPETGYDEKVYYEEIKRNPLAREVKLADLKHNSDPSRIPEGISPEQREKMLRKKEYYREKIKYLQDV